MKVQAIAICGPGRVRAQNQDSFYLNGSYRGEVDDTRSLIGSTCFESGILAVADGMGGEKHGELASLEAVRCTRQAQKNGSSDLSRIIFESNERVCALMDMYRERIGSTYVGLSFEGGSVTVTNIGDSRAYLMRSGVLRRLSRDHTAIQRLLDMGVINAEQAKTHKARHQITQHIGLYPDELIIEPFTDNISVLPGDMYLLCSDGLTDMVTDPDIESILAAKGSLHDKACALYKSALFNGGRDNCTVVLAELTED